MVSRARTRRTRQDNLPGLRRRVGLDDNSIDLGGTEKIILSADGYLLGIGAGLDVNDIAGLGGIDGGLDRRETGSIVSTSSVGTANEKYG